ncbi:MAG: PQQ-dependent sugar dehydrogenase [Rhizobiaceae bacterium]|nr:PQQ-dependent sugar dehydrogenase [Rhizobiaceae bacterium]
MTFANCAAALDEVAQTEKIKIHVETFAEGLSHPWGLAFLPDRTMLVTERDGRLRHVKDDGTLSEPIKGVPDVDARDQGGLLDIVLDPNFSENRLVYLSFAEAGEGGDNSTAVAKAALSEDNTELTNVEVIFSQQPKLPSTLHFGGRLVFDDAGHLFVALGERSKEEFRGQAQDLDSHLGKVVRINTDGSAPEDNPFVGQEGALPETWSLGHRNIQAAAINPATGVLWEIEHGPLGGDELNVVQPGKNYGWPIVSFGVNYSGSPVGSGESEAPKFEPPIYQWTPVIAPSGMAFYGGRAFPEWEGNLFVGALKETALVRLELDGDRVTHEERILDDTLPRIRDVVEGPDGALYLLTDEDRGEILRISPAEGDATQ